MSKGIRIEVFKKDDRDEVSRLLLEAKLPVQDLTFEKLKTFLVARRTDGSVIGAIGVELHGDTGLLRSLVVHPSHRGEGLGKRLTRHLESFSRRKGIKDLYLLTTTAAEFFPKLGYQSIERDHVPGAVAGTEEFKNICPVSAVCFFKNLRFP